MLGRKKERGEGEGRKKYPAPFDLPQFLPSFRVSTCAFASERFARPKKTPALQAKPNSAFSLTWSASMLIYWNKRKFLHKKRVQLPQDWFGTPTWPPFHCSETLIWPPWRHVKTLYILGPVYKTWRTVYMRIWNETLARLEAGHPLFNGVFILRY